MTMRSTLLVFLSAGIIPASLAMSGSPDAPATPITVGTDTIKHRAIAVLEANLAALRLVHQDAGSWVNSFLDMSAKHPCDVCPTMEVMPVETYAFQVAQEYPGGFIFTHSLAQERIELASYGSKDWVARIPYSKRFTLPNGKKRVVHLIATIKLDYMAGVHAVQSVVEEKPPGNDMFMLELSPSLGIGKGDFTQATGLDPGSSTARYTAGVVYYFYPFPTTNRSNIWFKTGLRVNLRSSELDQNELQYHQTGVELDPHAPSVPGMPHRIDLSQRISDLEEKVKSTVLQVPLGISKRWTVNERVLVSLEAEIAYGVEIARSITGRYIVDQTGTNHLLAGSIMTASGGSVLVYDASDAAVVDAGGRRVDFFTGQQAVLDGLEMKKSSVLSFGLRPGLFLERHGQVRYHIGLDLLMVGNQRADDHSLDSGYFLNSSDPGRPALVTLNQRAFTTFAGLTISIKL